MAKKRRQRSGANGKSRAGAQSILRAAHEIEAMLRDGASLHERFTVRTIQSLDGPREFTPPQVRALRLRLNVSQPVFAAMIGASTILVQSWEQGKRQPNRMARRLLEEMDADPGRWLAKLRRQPAA